MKQDVMTENLFSLIRWIFILAVSLMYFFPTTHEFLMFTGDSFIVLIIFYTAYNTAVQYGLWRMNRTVVRLNWLLKSGVLVDYVAFTWLLSITGGAGSEFTPVMYLILMHAVIYWKEWGAVGMTVALLAGYWTVAVFSVELMDTVLLHVVLNSFFLIVISLFSSLLVLRERKHMENTVHLSQQLREDYLTGLYNVRHFNEELEKMVNEKRSFSLMLGDVDHFKEVNDQYGHVFGDEVLEEIGSVFKEISLEFGGRAFRYGGEEFVFIFPDSTFSVESFLQKVRETLNGLSFTNHQLHPTISFGQAVYDGKQSTDQLIEEADQRLYRAKKNGRACAVLKDESIIRWDQNNKGRIL